MIFKRKDSFFLDLSKAGSTAPESKPAGTQPAATPSKPAAPAVEKPTATEAAEAPAPLAPAAQPALTTAEAVAAELRAAQEARPVPSNVTFAPDCLNPANAVPSRRRRAGANLGLFKGMVDEMFRS
ncbi:hypothetical protein KBY96_05260 [Cyanobium sp. ATX 6A2]|nr:hypothetical protein [Cyanobium sp. ATX 6A2]